MSEVLQLIRIHVNELDLMGVEGYYQESRERLRQVDGFRGISLWRKSGTYDELLVLHEYSSSDAPDRGLEALAGIKMLAESQTADYRPADLLRIQVQGRLGCRPSETPRPSFLSMSIRVADPGYQTELLDEIGVIFQELQFIPGYIGAVYGYRDSLPEEVAGLVMWESPEAFSHSLPPKQRKYDVRLYEHIY